ncbi:MAG: hypothetical protein ACFE0J_22265 [Elainellaceae cyanobacterium]
MTLPMTEYPKTDTGSENAFPIAIQDAGELRVHHGITKREYFAAMALQGMLASGCQTRYLTAKGAVEAADALIDALNAHSNAHISHADRTLDAQS